MNSIEREKKKSCFFIMGLDQFYIFSDWKKHKEILKKSSLIVTSRPGLKFPKRRSDFPETIQNFVKSQFLKEESLNEIKKNIL